MSEINFLIEDIWLVECKKNYFFFVLEFFFFEKGN